MNRTANEHPADPRIPAKGVAVRQETPMPPPPPMAAPITTRHPWDTRSDGEQQNPEWSGLPVPPMPPKETPAVRTHMPLFDKTSADTAKGAFSRLADRISNMPATHKVHYVIDIETLSTKVATPIYAVAVAAVVESPEIAWMCGCASTAIDLKDLAVHGADVDLGTLMWHISTHKGADIDLVTACGVGTSGRMTISELIDAINALGDASKHMGKDSTFWHARGKDFDIPRIQWYADKLGKPLRYQYWQYHCIRGWFAGLAGEGTGVCPLPDNKPEAKHTAGEDALLEAGEVLWVLHKLFGVKIDVN